MQLRFVKGLSDKRIEDLKKLNITSAESLVKLYPRSYLDLRRQVSLKEAVNNAFVLTKGTVINIQPSVVKNGRFNFFKIFCEQDGEVFTVIWFNQPYVHAKLKLGETYLFYGRVRNRFAISITNPTFEVFDNNVNLKGIIPVYPLKGNLTQKAVKNAVADALNKVEITTAIPDRIVKKYNLAPLNAAAYEVHFPSSMETLAAASDRIALEEYFLLISAFKIIKGDRSEARKNKYTVTASDVKGFSSRFNFEFTKGQKDAVNQVFSDLRSPLVMNRLLQGDVGSGKTAVSLCAVFCAVKSGYQAALIAPTEVLARQNFNLIEKLFSDYTCAFLSGSTTEKEKRLIKAVLLL